MLRRRGGIVNGRIDPTTADVSKVKLAPSRMARTSADPDVPTQPDLGSRGRMRRSRDGLPAPVESNVAVGELVGSESSVVGSVVVPAAVEDAVVEVGLAALDQGSSDVLRTSGRGLCSPRRGIAGRAAHGFALGGEKRRRVRPRSRISPLPPRTTGMMLALQASRRSAVAEIPRIAADDPPVASSAWSESRRW